MANIGHPHRNEKPCGEIVKFYLPPNAQYRKGERIPVQINGYLYQPIVGETNEFPEEIVQVLEEAKSRTSVPDLDRYDPERYGVPRSQDEFFNPRMKAVYQQDFDIKRL
jgi:hypothetical protein